MVLLFASAFALKTRRPLSMSLSSSSSSDPASSSPSSSSSSAPGAWKAVSRRSILQSIAATASLIPLNGLANIYDSEVPPDLATFAERVKTFTLDNGAKFVVLERGVSPTVSFVTYVDVGGSDEIPGKTGIAHFLEHLAFKGTETIGTRDYNTEKDILDDLSMLTEARRTEQDEEKAKELDELISELQKEAEELVIPNDFARIVQQEGGVGLNAATSIDNTQYFYNFPSNKVELWFALESERFTKPVFRQFEKEKMVVLEERKLRVDNDSIGKFLEGFLMKSFDTHPYRRPVIGYEEDIEGLTRQDVRAFFEKYYQPRNLTFGIVGDVNFDEVKKMAEKYFGPIEDKPIGARVIPPEPEQTEQKEFEIKLNAEPWYIEGYHVPALGSDDYPALRLLEGVLSGGRTSKLVKSLVFEKRVALQASFSSGFPGDKYPNLGVFFALPAQGVELKTLESALRAEIDAVTVDGAVSEAELGKVKRSQKVAYLSSFQSNESVAGYLCEYSAKTGDPRNAFRELSAMEQVTPDDVTRLARNIFTSSNRTIGRLI